LIQQAASAETKTGIRPLRPSRDLAQLAELIEQSFGKELSEGGEQVLRELRLLSHLGPLSLLAVAASAQTEGLFNGLVWVEEGRVVGNVTISRPSGHPRRWQISNVAVLEAYRRQGIGRSLVETAIDVILRQGGQTAYLYVREDNPTAVHLYENLGFLQVDRIIDLALGPREPVSRGLGLLGRLRAAEGLALYELATVASGPGQRWLSLPHRRRFVRTADERFFSWLGSPLMGERESFWGAHDDHQRLCVGVSLKARRGWDRRPHRVELWVHPSVRGQLEESLVEDVLVLLARQNARRAVISLPACEHAAVDALLRHSFREIRTLILMKLEL
jgi:ribosomal protein S18 acetylase RimI-like enzyme